MKTKPQNNHNDAMPENIENCREIGIPEDLLADTGFGKEGYSIMLTPILKMMEVENKDPLKTKEKVNSLIAAIADLNARDGFECLLISQMISVYEASIDCLRLANINKAYSEIFFKLQNQSIKLMKLNTQQLETLDKHRNKGNQKMTIEHVHINDGAQAIIGEVHQKGGGGDEH